MTLMFGSIVIHKPNPKSNTDACNVNSDDAEVAEIAETVNKKHGVARRSEKRTLNKSLKNRRSSLSPAGSNEASILRIMITDRSPPLVRSHYTQQIEDRLQGKDVLRERKHHKNSTNALSQMKTEGGERVGFRMLTSGSRTSDKSITQKRTTAAIPDITSSFTTPFVPVIDDQAAINGILRLLKNLNFPEKLRQQRADEERLNIHKLPTHMREQLKHIYVY